MLLFGFVAVVCMLFSLGDTKSNPLLRTVNVDGNFSRWAGSKVYYCIDAGFTAGEVSTINSAIQSISQSIPCISWTAVACTSTTYKAWLSPSAPTPTGGSQSWSYPGVYGTNVKNGLNYQYVGLARDATNCPSTVRCVLKYLAILLGKRNEHQRGDRDNYITVNLANTNVPANYNLYTNSSAMWSLLPYDYCSITHSQPTDYAIGVNPVFTVSASSGLTSMPMLNTLSTTDCKWLSYLYGTSTCPIANCVVINCGSSSSGGSATTVAGSATTVAGATTAVVVTTTTAPVTTTIACPAFCPTAAGGVVPTITESSQIYNGNYYFFYGTPVQCAIQVTQYGVLVTKTPVSVSSLFPSVTAPVVAVYTDPQSTLTTVQTATNSYVCNSFGCLAAAAGANMNPIFEYTASSAMSVTPYQITTTGTMYSPPPAGSAITTVTCTGTCTVNAPTQPTLTAWTSGYMVNNGGGTTFPFLANSVLIIGTSTAAASPTQQFIQLMSSTGVNTWAFTTPSSMLTPMYMGCPAMG